MQTETLAPRATETPAAVLAAMAAFGVICRGEQPDTRAASSALWQHQSWVTRSGTERCVIKSIVRALDKGDLDGASKLAAGWQREFA